MKKLIAMLLAVVMVCSLAACGGKTNESKDYSGYTIRIYSNSNSTERATWLVEEAKKAGFTISLDDNSVISGDVAAIQADVVTVTADNIAEIFFEGGVYDGSKYTGWQ